MTMTKVMDVMTAEEALAAAHRAREARKAMMRGGKPEPVKAVEVPVVSPEKVVKDLKSKALGMRLLRREKFVPEMPYAEAVEKLPEKVRMALEDEGMLTPNEVSEIYHVGVQPFQLANVVDAAAMLMGLQTAAFKGESRKRTLVHMRQAVCWIGVECMGMTLKQTGKVLGGRDHTTILHGVRQCEDRIAMLNKHGDAERLRLKNIMRAALFAHPGVCKAWGIEEPVRRAILKKLRG